MYRWIPTSFAILLCALASPAQEVPLDAVRESLQRALSGMGALQNEGGWGRACTAVREIVWGQDTPIATDAITLQPPATPSVARVYLRAAKLFEDSRWREVAQAAQQAIVAMQGELGGFPKEGKPKRPPRGEGSFDDGVTTGCTEFLLDWWQYTGKEEDRDPVDKAGGFILAAQYADSGGWPQRFPYKGTDYPKDITLNDGVMRNILFTLLRLHGATGDVRYLDAARKGGECIIRLQGADAESIWAQQYDHETLEPSWARAFEPPGYSPAESAGICDALIALHFATGDTRYLSPLPRAFAWYDTHRLENGLYARLYEPGTQRPVYGRRDKPEKVYDVDQATGGYGWQGDWYPTQAKRWHDGIAARGSDACRADYLAEAKRVSTPNAARVRSVMDALTASGRWETAPTESELKEYQRQGIAPELPLIHSGTFCANATVLLDYLETHRPTGETP